MTTRQIPRDEWKEFFDAFSRQHEGWLVNVEVLDADIGDQMEAQDLPLQGISVDTKGSRHRSIDIIVGNSPDDHITHIISGPAFIRFLQADDQSHAGLEIESEDGQKTLVQFRSAAQPELLEGIQGRPRVRRAGLGRRDEGAQKE